MPPPGFQRHGLIWIGIVSLLVLAPWTSSLAKRPLKDPPLSVTVGALVTAQDEYDGRRVIVTGRIRSMELQKGRRGSQYVKIVLEEVGTDSRQPVPTVDIIILSVPSVRPGGLALVQGVYHREGRQGGWPLEHFIEAEVILKERF